MMRGRRCAMPDPDQPKPGKPALHVDLSKFTGSVPVDAALRQKLAEAGAALAALAKHAQETASQLKGLEAQDRMGNFEIQRLMSAYNQAETLASSVQKKMDDTVGAVIGKI